MKDRWTHKRRMALFAFYSQFLVLIGMCVLALYVSHDTLYPLVTLACAYFTSMSAVVGVYIGFSAKDLNLQANYGMNNMYGVNYGYGNYSQPYMRPVTPTPDPKITKAVDNPDGR